MLRDSLIDTFFDQSFINLGERGITVSLCSSLVDKLPCNLSRNEPGFEFFQSAAKTKKAPKRGFSVLVAVREGLRGLRPRPSGSLAMRGRLSHPAGMLGSNQRVRPHISDRYKQKTRIERAVCLWR